MKNFCKILTVLLALVIAVTALVVIGAADDGEVTIVTTEEQFKTAATDGAKIKLGGDLTLAGTLDVAGALEVDLGGNTLTLTNNGKYFAVKNGGTLTLTGTGTINATIVAEVEKGGTLTINGTGKGIDLVQANTTAPLFNLKAGSATTLKGVVTAAPYQLANTTPRLFTVGELTTGLTTKATLKVENATVTIKEPHTGLQATSEYHQGMTFACVNDGADIDITNSTITMKHGHFVQKDSATVGTSVSSGVTDNSIDATTLDGLTLPEGDNITIDITGSEISALNSGYNKYLTNWSDSTSGGFLFNLGNVAVTVNVTDTTLVGTNRTMTVGENNKTASNIYPAYFNFKNVNFLTSDFTEYATALLYGNFNVKWDGGIIVLRKASNKAIVSLGSGTNDATYKTNPFGDEAFKAAQIAHSGLSEEEFNNQYNDANPYTGLTREKFNSLYYAHTTRVNDTNTVTNTYYETSVVGSWDGKDLITGGDLSVFGFRYSESTDGTKWCGKQFNNVSCNGWIDNAKDTYAIGTTTKYETFTVLNPLNDREVITMRVGYLDEAPTIYIPEYANDAMNNVGESGYTLDYLNKSSGTSTVSEIEKGHVWSNTAPPFSSAVKAPWRYGKYSEVSQNGNGYVKFSVDADTIRTNGETLSVADGTLIGTPAEGTTYTWTPNGNSSPYTAFLYGSTNRYKSNGTTAENKIDGVAYYVHELDIATDTGLYPQTNVTTYARYGQYSYASKTSSPTFSGAHQIIYTELFKIAENGTLSAGAGLTAESGSFSLATDGSWTRITVVYQIVKNETTMSITATDKTTLENVAAYCYNGSKAYVYVDGILYGTAAIFNDVTLPKDVVSKQFGMDQLRFGQNYSNRKEGTSICWDNNRVSAYFTETDSLKKVSNGAKNITNESDFLVMPKSNNITMPNVSVTWKGTDGATLGTTEVGIGSLIAPTDDILAAAGGSRQEQNNGWYDLGLGWKDDSGNVVDLSSLKAETGKTYTFTATTAPIAPTKVEGIKINLSLYTDFALNVYVPTKVPSNVTDVKLSGGGIAVGTFVRWVTGTDANGKTTTTLKYSTNGEVTIEGVNYIGYTDRIGVADTSCDTYKLSYTVTVDGVATTVTYDIEYGVPAYAVQVMTDAKNQYSDDAKTLVMNMVNYASLVVKYQNADTTSDGYKLYEKLLSIEKYKALVTTIADSEFLKGKDGATDGSIYTSDISKLNYKDSSVASTKYIEGAGVYFSSSQPMFYFELSEAAKNHSYTYDIYTVNVTTGEDGTTTTTKGTVTTKTVSGIHKRQAYWYEGLSAYVGFNDVTNGKKAPAVMKAYKGGDIITGTDVTNVAGVFSDTTGYDTYDRTDVRYYMILSPFGDVKPGGVVSNGYTRYKLCDFVGSVGVDILDNNGISEATKVAELKTMGLEGIVKTDGSYAIDDDGNRIKISDVVKDSDGNVTSYKVTEIVNNSQKTVTYSLAAYVGGMIEARDSATDESKKQEYSAAAELGKALYAYAQSAKAYVDGNNNGK